MFRFLSALILFVCAFAARAQDGIFADFETSLGNFTCQLHYDRAPKTVANFIGLATGERAWLDLPTGDAKRRPFYDGIIFHRVINGFMIQGGSPNGQGTDGPGYAFVDEFHPTLRHNAAGVLSMANSGVNSNGSQFFVTLGAASHLDDLHSVFGNVTAGMSVVQAIGAVPVDGNDKPVTPVVMQSARIRRVGAAAQAFNIHGQSLPFVGGAKPQLLKPTASTLALRFTKTQASEYLVYHSADLLAWNRVRVGFFHTAPPAADFDVTATAGQTRYFYRVPEIVYAAPIYSPGTLRSSTVTVTITGGKYAGNVVAYAFNSAGTGTCVLNGNSSGTISPDSTWTEGGPFRGTMLAFSSNVLPMQLLLSFRNGSGGTFNGSIYEVVNNQYVPVAASGTFTFAPQ